jgi:hypothetical protein
MQFTFPYSFSIFNTCFFAFAQTSFVILPNRPLKSRSVIVLDNASYHNIKTEEAVVSNFNQRKAVLQDYLSKHNIPFQPLETKKQFSNQFRKVGPFISW